MGGDGGFLVVEVEVEVEVEGGRLVPEEVSSDPEAVTVGRLQARVQQDTTPAETKTRFLR